MKKVTITSIIMITIIVFHSGCIEEQKSKTSEKTTSEIATEFITYLSQGNYETAYSYFNSTVKNQFSFAQFQGTWEYFIVTYGEYESIQNTIPSTESGYNIIRINCTFTDGYVITFRIVFDGLNEISGFWTDKIETIKPYVTPEYVNTSSFTESEVTIGSGAWELPATITIPNGDGPFPSVVLVHGSGANDRDETIGPNKPFKDIAWGLASNNIIVLRYDKRTKVYPEETAGDKNLTVKEEVVDDAIEAVKIFQTYEKVNQNQIYVLGHSLGAMMAPQIATFEENLTGLIMLAAPARSLEDLMYNQTVYLSELDDVIDENETLVINMTKDALEKIKTLNMSEDERVLSVHKAYWEYLNKYDQVKTADNLTIPILLLQGKRDYQVTYEEDFAIWSTTFNDNNNTLLKTYDLLNHLFIPGEGQPTNTEYMIQGHVSEDVIKDITSWIKGEN
jgi:esterase/lipase